MVHITVCHLLLGRTWLYDRKVLYGGYANSYSFKFNDKKFITDPLQIFEFEAQKKSRSYSSANHSAVHSSSKRRKTNVIGNEPIG